MYSIFKMYYPMGYFTIQQCKDAVYVGWLTTEQFKEITGQDYVDASTSTSAGASESANTATSQA